MTSYFSWHREFVVLKTVTVNNNEDKTFKRVKNSNEIPNCKIFISNLVSSIIMLSPDLDLPEKW